MTLTTPAFWITNVGNDKYVVSKAKHLPNDQPLTKQEALDLWRMAKAGQVVFTNRAKDELIFLDRRPLQNQRVALEQALEASE